MTRGTIPLGYVLGGVLLAGCGNSSGPGQSIHYQPPNVEFAAGLGIAPPVTQDQAMAIAAAAAGGTAVSATQEMEDRVLFFEVRVDTPSGPKEVEVRSTDGGVVEIEPADRD